MRKLTGLAIAASGVFIGIAAAAADPLPGAYNWGGLYAGLNVGGVWDNGSLRDSGTTVSYPPFALVDTTGAIFTRGIPTFVPGTIPLPAAVRSSSNGNGSFMGGGQLGHNWQWGPTVFGLEADIQGLDASQRFTLVTTPGQLTLPGLVNNFSGGGTIERSVQGSLRGRLGYAWDRLMLYGTTGVALTELHTRATYNYTFALPPGFTPVPGITNPTNTTNSFSHGQARAGITLGGGVEYGLWETISLGLEYRHTFFGTAGLNLGSTPTTVSLMNVAVPGGIVTPGSPVTARYRLDTDAIMMRLNYHFGAPPPPPPEMPPAPPPPPQRISFIVFFDWDKDVITREGMEVVQKAAAAYRAGGMVQIQVTGYTDRSGSAGYNQRLSERRANNVAKALAGLGVPPNQMAVSGRGENDNRVPTADGVREPQNRRVEIGWP
jgi:opacity protein-like surface antigen